MSSSDALRSPLDRPSLAVEDQRVIIRFAYDANRVAAVKLVKGTRWDARGQYWWVPAKLEYLREVGEFAKAHGFEIPEALRELWRSLKRQERVNLEASRAEDSEGTEIPGLGGTLRPFQRAGVAYLSRLERALLGDEMGLGKTPQALACLAKLEAFPAVIVCPASLQYNWEREALRWLPGKAVHVVSRDHPPTRHAHLNVINYSILPKHLEKLSAIDPVAVVFDEFHYCKNGKTARAKAAASLARRARYRFGLTGTPVDNGDPAELVPMLQILGRMDDFGGPLNFLRNYCEQILVPTFVRGCVSISGLPCEPVSFDGVRVGEEVFRRDRPMERFVVSQTRPGKLWLDRQARTKELTAEDWTGFFRIVKRMESRPTEEGLERLAAKLRSTCMIRRLKSDVAKELPQKQQTLLPVEISNGPEYRGAQTDVLRWVAERAAADPAFRDQIAHLPEEARLRLIAKRAMEAALRAESAEELVKLNALLQIGAQGKLSAAKDWISSFLDSGQSLVCFAEHTAIIEAICAEFQVPAITGATAPKERQRIVDAFQNGKNRLIPCNWQAGGVGITLTRASHVLGLELPWKPSTLDQGEDRCHRIGQQNAVNIWYLIGRGTLDAMLWGLLNEKRAVARLALGDLSAPAESEV